MKQARKSNSIDCDLNIIVEQKQFHAHWRILQANSDFFKEFYSRKSCAARSRRKKSTRVKTVDVVHLKGISAELFGKFLRFVYSDTRLKHERQLVLKEVKDVLKFSLLFGVRHLTSLTTKPCLEELAVNMEDTGFSAMSDLHQASLRFLYDRTSMRSTREIANFVAREAYKDASFECLLRVLKIVSGSDDRKGNVEIRLKLLDVLVTLFSAGLDGVSARPDMEDGGKCVRRRGMEDVREVIVNCRKRQENEKLEQANSDNLDGEGTIVTMRDERMKSGKGRIKRNGKGNLQVRPSMNVTSKERHELVGKGGQKLSNETPQDSTRNTNSRGRTKSRSFKEKPARRTNDTKQRDETALKTKGLICVREKTFIEQETRVIRRNVQKRWRGEETIPAVLCQKEEARLNPIETMSRGQEDSAGKSNAIQAEHGHQINQVSSEALVHRVSPKRQPERLFLTGGIQKNGYFASRAFLEYDPINSVCVTHSAMNTCRYNHGIVQVTDELYVVGGNSGFFEQLRGVESYSVERTEWSAENASMHEARDEFSLVACDGCLYAIGGHNGIQDLRSVERLVVADREKACGWSLVSSMGSYRAGACAVAVNDRYIYVTGGFNGQVYLKSVELYDTTSDRWTEIEPMNMKRAYSSPVLFGDEIYILGGFDGQEALSSCEVYGVETKTWKALSDMNTARMNATAVVFMENLFALGGECGSVFLETVECYDMTNQTWYFVQRLPQPMAGLRACVYRGEKQPRREETAKNEIKMSSR